MVNNNKKIGQNFIVSFYNEARVLLGSYASYVNTLIEIGNVNDPNRLEDSSKLIFTQSVQTVRSSVSITYLMLETIKTKLKFDLKPNLKKTHDNIIDNFVIKRVDLQDYIIEINKVIASEIMQDLLQTDKDVVDNIYGEEQKPN